MERLYTLLPRLIGWVGDWTLGPSVKVVRRAITQRMTARRKYSKSTWPLVLEKFELEGGFVILSSGFENGDNGQYHDCLDED